MPSIDELIASDDVAPRIHNIGLFAFKVNGLVIGKPIEQQLQELHAKAPPPDAKHTTAAPPPAKRRKKTTDTKDKILACIDSSWKAKTKDVEDVSTVVMENALMTADDKQEWIRLFHKFMLLYHHYYKDIPAVQQALAAPPCDGDFAKIKKDPDFVKTLRIMLDAYYVHPPALQ